MVERVSPRDSFTEYTCICGLWKTKHSFHPTHVGAHRELPENLNQAGEPQTQMDVQSTSWEEGAAPAHREASLGFLLLKRNHIRGLCLSLSQQRRSRDPGSI